MGKKALVVNSLTNCDPDEAAALLDEKQCTLWIGGVCVAILDYRRHKVTSNLRASTLVKQFSHPLSINVALCILPRL